MFVGGFGAPLFLFLAGVAASLSAASKARRSGDIRTAARMVAWRGLQIFALGWLFRVQAWILGLGAARTLLKVDILNIMGLSIAAAAVLWACAARTRSRVMLFAGGCAAIALATPLVHAPPMLSPLPDPVEAYLRPIPGLTNFAVFPWTGFLFAGVGLGVLIVATGTAVEERRTNLWAGIAGSVLALTAYGLSYLPSPYAFTYFWTNSPAFFAMRAGLLILATTLAFAWEWRTGGADRWSPLQQLGRTSLFIYWIHVEMVYGLISLPLHKALTLGQAGGAFVAFAVFMLGCSIAKDRVVAWWIARRQRSVRAAVAYGGEGIPEIRASDRKEGSRSVGNLTRQR
jgi:uncharacterized membrane protein